jgi:hypothetical protein
MGIENEAIDIMIESSWIAVEARSSCLEQPSTWMVIFRQLRLAELDKKQSTSSFAIPILSVDRVT